MKLKRLHYGWVMVILGMLCLATYAMSFYTFGIFLRPITTSFGWERGELSIAQSIALLIGGGLGILAGRLSDKYGPRLLVTAAGIAAGSGYLLMSQIHALWQVYLYWGLLIGIAWAFCQIPITSGIPRWFQKRRGLAQGLAMTGVALGGVIWPPVAQWLISSYGWQKAYIILGFTTMVIIISAAQFLRHSPQRIGLTPYGGDEPGSGKKSTNSETSGLSLKQAIKTGRFWMFGLISFAFMYTVQPMVIHIVPHAVDIGLSATIAASIASTLAAASVVGRITIGLVSDRMGPRRAVVACVSLFTLALAWLIFADEAWMLYVFAIVFGFAFGGETAVSALVPAELFGIEYLGALAASTTLFGTIGGSIGTPLAGGIFDVTGSYRLAFMISMILGALAIILAFILLRSKSYRDTNEQVR